MAMLAKTNTNERALKPAGAELLMAQLDPAQPEIARIVAAATRGFIA